MTGRKHAPRIACPANQQIESEQRSGNHQSGVRLPYRVRSTNRGARLRQRRLFIVSTYLCRNPLKETRAPGMIRTTDLVPLERPEWVSSGNYSAKSSTGGFGSQSGSHSKIPVSVAVRPLAVTRFFNRELGLFPRRRPQVRFGTCPASVGRHRMLSVHSYPI